MTDDELHNAFKTHPAISPPMAFEPSPVTLAPPRVDAPDPRFTDLFVDGDADVHFAGVPFDASVLGRKGAKGGPSGIREAFRFLSTNDPGGPCMEGLRIWDHGDVVGLSDDVLASHAAVRTAARGLHALPGRTVLVGGDHGLTFPHVQALADTVDGDIGIVVIDAHYDLRDYTVQPSSGTPFYRILHELGGRVKGTNIAEIGIRPWANTQMLATRADELGVHIHTMRDVASHGIEAVIEDALEAAGDGVDHLWLSIDIDGLDQSIASGCSAPGAGGLTFDQGDHIIRRVAADPRCRGMDLLEVAPGLDPTGNTCRTAAQLLASFIASGPRRV